MNFRQREYFETARQGADPSTLCVSSPFKTSRGIFGVNLAKVIFTPQGDFSGIVAATLDPEYFTTLLGSIAYAPDLRTNISHGDGIVFLMIPKTGDFEAVDLNKPGSLFRRYFESGQVATVTRGIATTDGREILLAQRAIHPASLNMNKPLVVAVRRNWNALFAPWRQNAMRLGGLFGLLVLATVLGQHYYRRRQRQFARIAAEHQAEQQRCAERYLAITRTSLDGFSIIGSSGQTLDANNSFCRMLGYSREELIRLNISDLEADKISRGNRGAQPQDHGGRTRHFRNPGTGTKTGAC